MLSCLVRDSCVHWAIDQHIDYGVWGGRSETPRSPCGGAPPRRPSNQLAHLTPDDPHPHLQNADELTP